MPLVSRRFSEACREPALWPELHVLLAQLWSHRRQRSFLRWLAPRAPGLRTLVIGDPVVSYILLLSFACKFVMKT